MLRHDWYFVSADLTTSRTRSSAYIGYECRKGLCSRSQCRPTGHCTVMPSVHTAVYTSRRHPVPTKTSVFHLGRSVRSCRQTAYCWTSCFLCRWRSCLKRSSCRRHLSTFSVHFQKTFKTASFSTLPSWPCPLSHFLSLRMVLVVAVCYLGYPKIYWLNDWLWQESLADAKASARQQCVYCMKTPYAKKSTANQSAICNYLLMTNSN